MKKLNSVIILSTILTLIGCSSTEHESSVILSSEELSSIEEISSVDVSSEESVSCEEISSEEISESSEEIISSDSIEETSSEHTPTLQEIYDLRTPNSYLPDSNFKQGFSVWYPQLSGAYIEGALDYGGERQINPFCPLNIEGLMTYYNIPQWQAAKSIYDSKLTKNGHKYTYKNEYREFAVDVDKGELTMGVNTYKEYQDLYGGSKPHDAFWSHFLIESQFPGDLCKSLAQLDNLYVKFDIEFNKLDCLGQDPAQFFFYFNFRDFTLGRNIMWFGLPIYDSRYDYIPEYKQLDNLSESNTGLPIYSLCSRYYMGKDKIIVGQKYSIDFEVLDYIKDGFVYWAQEGAFAEDVDFNNLMLYYMNIGWEIPGQYDVSATISNFDIYSEEE